MMTKNKRHVLIQLGLLFAFVNQLNVSTQFAHKLSEREDKKKHEGPDEEKEEKEIESEDMRAGRKKVIMCAIVKDEEAYIDEWVDYHHALGFDEFHIYDNTELFEMKEWARMQGHHIKVTHFPAKQRQSSVYFDCAKNAIEEGFVWAAFFDIDEFLQLKKHNDMVEFLEEYASSGAIAINWLLFLPRKEDVLYSPLPLTKRFKYHQKQTNQHIKSIARLNDMRLHGYLLIHDVKVKNGTLHDTNYHTVKGPFNIDGPIDVVVLHHYNRKSHKEFIAKTARGRADTDTDPNRLQFAQNLLTDALDPNNNTFTDNHYKTEDLVYNDFGWEAMKKLVPKYAMFDELTNLRG